MHWADLGMGAGGFAGAALLIIPFFKKSAARVLRALLSGIITELRDAIEARFDSNDEKTDDVKKDIAAIDQRVVKIEAQFGPNGGGLREAVNKVQLDVVALQTDVSWLKGKAST